MSAPKRDGADSEGNKEETSGFLWVAWPSLQCQTIPCPFGCDFSEGSPVVFQQLRWCQILPITILLTADTL